jgi:hypothetical protein
MSLSVANLDTTTFTQPVKKLPAFTDIEVWLGARFEVLAAVTKKITFFWDMTPCRLVEFIKVSKERKIYQDSQCTCNVTMRRVQKTIVVVEQQQVLHTSVCVCVCVVGVSGCTGACVCLRACSLTNPAGNSPPYCHLWPLRIHRIFRRYIINGTIFRGKKSYWT